MHGRILDRYGVRPDFSVTEVDSDHAIYFRFVVFCVVLAPPWPTPVRVGPRCLTLFMSE
ncbi:hypothetical protein RSAG8_10636, partial [Rhizoctonia solani AG-8 WAC10335]